MLGRFFYTSRSFFVDRGRTLKEKSSKNWETDTGRKEKKGKKMELEHEAKEAQEDIRLISPLNAQAAGPHQVIAHKDVWRWSKA